MSISDTSFTNTCRSLSDVTPSFVKACNVSSESWLCSRRGPNTSATCQVGTTFSGERSTVTLCVNSCTRLPGSWQGGYTRMHTHACTHAHTHAHMHARTHSPTHAHSTHAYTHTHAHDAPNRHALQIQAQREGQWNSASCSSSPGTAMHCCAPVLQSAHTVLQLQCVAPMHVS